MRVFSILIFAHSSADCSIIESQLRKIANKPEITVVSDIGDYESAISKHKFDVILLDLNNPENDAPPLLVLSKRHQPTTPIILISDKLENEEVKANLVKLEAKDFISKTNIERLVSTIQKSLEESEATSQILGPNEPILNILEEYKLILENSPHSLVFVSGDGKILDVNPAFCEMLGYSKEELIGKNFISITHPEDIAKSKEFEEEILSGRKTGGYLEKRYIHKNGRIVWALLFTRLIRDENGNPKYFVTHLEDITERKQREAKLLLQSEIINSVYAACIVLDKYGKVEFWNKTAEKILGWTAEEILGQSLKDIFLFPKSILEQIISITKNDQFIKNEIKGYTKSGETKIFGSIINKLKASEYISEDKIMILLVDLTEKKLLEEKLMQAQRVETIGMLAGGIAHDLNNCLTPIKMGTELLSQKVSDDKCLELLSKIEKSVDKGISIVRQILTYGRGVKEEKERVNLNYLVSEIKNIIMITFPPDIDLVVKKDNNLWDIWGERTKLHQAILNLCVNARDAMPEGGKLTINTANIELNGENIKSIPNAKPGLYVLLEVSDTGSGIPPEILDKIFMPFFTTKESGKGTGLGLFIVKKVVEEHNGFIQVSSRPNEGTTFSMYFPAETKRLSGEDRIEKLQSLPRGNGETILLVDDNEPVRTICREFLENYGYNVVEAVDGADAIGVYLKNKDNVRLIIMDMSMPIMDGPAAIKVIRKFDKSIPILAASALTTPPLHLDMEGDNIHVMLQKPFDLEELLTSIAAALKANS